MSGTSLIGLRRWCAGVLILLAMAVGPVHGGDLTERLLDDARDGQLNEFDFVTAALVAGGIDDECELQGWLDRYLDCRESLLGSLPTSEPWQQLEAIHEALHEQLLSGKYDATASDLRLTLDHGDFNCLSSLAVYLDLCQACELPVQIWLARGHVFLRAVGEDGPVDIEPGTPEWESRAMVRRNGLRRITIVELLGKFFYNRGVELLKAQQFAEGIELLRISLDLDPADSDARANLVAGLNNWAVEYLRTGRYEDAAGLIEQGLFFDPGFAPLITNEQLVRVNRAGR
jgi:tetratricopeptide (TPR) repeat protein